MVGATPESLGIPPGSDLEKLLHRFVDESDYTLPDWLEALQEFREWIEAAAREYRAEAALEYVHCCALSTSAQVMKEVLWRVVGRMLDDFGFEDRPQTCSR